MKLTDRLKKAAGLAVLPAATVLIATALPLSAAHAQAQTPAAFMKVLTPRQNETLGTTRFNLDVQFKSLTNAPVVTAELWVDGVRWVRRDLDAPRRASVLSFLVDGSSLSAGAHNIVVKVLNADGDESSARVSVVAGSDEGENDAASGGPEVQFMNPGNGKKVAGNVELLVDAKSRNGQNPYVTFYVDKKFKTLKNYPPYSFVWDTTNETNGVHEVEASGYLDSNNTTTTRRIRVFVDNPGGNTVRMNGIPDLSATHKNRIAPKSVVTTTNTAAPIAKPVVSIAKSITRSVQVPLAPRFEAPIGEAQFSDSTAATVAAVDSLGLTATPDAAIAAISGAPRLSAPKAPRFVVPTVKRVVVATAVPSIKIAPTAVPVSGEPILSATTVSPMDDTNVTVAELANIVIAAPRTSLVAPHLARPAMPTAPIAAPVRTVIAPVKAQVSLAAPVKAVAAKAAVVAGNLAAPKATVHAAAPKVMVHVPSTTAPVHRVFLTEKPLQVAFDGQRIAFDVQPRVEAGLPIAPFRQIFEHTGGRVSWTNTTKTVRAVNADREIVIGVGKKDALVNGSVVSMGRAATIERGRTIVPLNFVGKALDMNVQYDPATGRLSITSKN